MSEIQSFEVTKGGYAGDLLSRKNAAKKPTVGFLACGYFEYWRMYKGLKEQVAADMAVIAERLSDKYDVIYPGLVYTLDGADAAGMFFRENHIDILIISEGTYCPDYFVHQALLHIPPSVPLCVYASQVHSTLDFASGYDQSLRNSGPMGLVQLTGGFRKMGKFENYEVVVGAIDDDDAYKDIDRIVTVQTTVHNLKHMTIGMIGHVFRGMYDFNFDNTAIAGKLGPHIMNVNIDHLMDILAGIGEDDGRVAALSDKVHDSYNVTGLDEGDIARSARLSTALMELVDQYKLDGLVLLGQHFIETQANATCYLGLSEILSARKAVAVTEGDAIGCVMAKVLQDFTGHTAFFGEWEEIDVELNAVMLLGHGFIDPSEARTDRPVNVKPACEDWGFKGNSLGFEATYPPGPVTMTHAIHDTKGWRILISEGEIIDTEPLRINESFLIVRVDKPVKKYFKELMQYGFSHHCIVAPGSVAEHLECFARQTNIEICRL